MIFTIGKTEVYEQYFREQGNPQKGITGSVWKTWRKAWWYTCNTEKFYSKEYGLYYWAWVPNSYSVYGVCADWERDTINTGNTWNDLIRPADLVKIRKEWGGTLP